MTRKEFVEKLFDTEIFAEFDERIADKGCQGFHCPPGTWCTACKYVGFWNKIVGKQEIKSALNMFYGIDYQFVIGGRGAGKSRVEEGVLLTQGWKKLPSIFNITPLKVLYDILDDATANGFEVKVHNGVIYYREGTYHDTDSAQDVD